MTDSDEALAHMAAVQNPIDALKTLRITTETCRHTTFEIFMKAYLHVKGGSAENLITISNVEAALHDWYRDHFRDQSIPDWLVRACVLSQKSELSA